jgi:hypothetical protein
MKYTWDFVVPYVGFEMDISFLYHTLRDILIIVVLWQIGFRDFQAAFTLLLVSGFFEAGNGVCYNSDGSHCFYNPLDILPSVFVGYFAVSIMSGVFELWLLVMLTLIFLISVLILIALNKVLGRDIIIKSIKR